MKAKIIITIALTAMILTSCESFKPDSEQEIFFKAGSDFEYKFSDIELYDSSTHILYFKDVHPEFENIGQTFTFLVNGEEIYSGFFRPAFLSSLPTGPFISTAPLFYQYYALRIENWYDRKPDMRNDPRIIQALEERHLLHSGLSVIINSIECDDSYLSFSFTVTNRDQSDLLILDPDKMGIKLFHYFTNGLRISKLNDKTTVFTSTIDHLSPEPWNSWETGWLSKIEHDVSKTFGFNYPIDSPIDPGEYYAFFEFPGLAYQIERDQLIRANKRIWLGDIRVTKNIVIE